MRAGETESHRRLDHLITLPGCGMARPPLKRFIKLGMSVDIAETMHDCCLQLNVCAVFEHMFVELVYAERLRSTWSKEPRIYLAAS